MTEQMLTRGLQGWVGSGDAATPDDREDRLLSWRSVRDIAGISRTTAWRMQQTGDFPNPVPISANRVGWWESDLTAWKATRRMASGGRPGPYRPAAGIPKARALSPKRDVEPLPGLAGGPTILTEPRPARRRKRS